MLLEQKVNLDPSTLVIVWINSSDSSAVAQRGFRTIQAPSDFFYLDCGAGGWVGSNPEGNSWCDPFKTWQKSYTYDPFANLTTEEQMLVIGGQSLLWTEQSGPENLDSIVWPRAAAGAEVFWTGNTLPTSMGGGPRNESAGTALPRLHDVSFRMRKRGVNTINLQPLWCAMRPGACDLTA